MVNDARKFPKSSPIDSYGGAMAGIEDPSDPRGQDLPPGEFKGEAARFDQGNDSSVITVGEAVEVRGAQEPLPQTELRSRGLRFRTRRAMRLAQ